MSHFIVSSVVGVMIAICGEAIPPRLVNGAVIGDNSNPCPACAEKVRTAWVAFPGL